MNTALVGIAALAIALAPLLARAEPITLKAAFFTSDRSVTYRAAVQPFVTAVNAEGRGLVEVVTYSGGILGRDVARQVRTILDGTADIAFLVPGHAQNDFPDNDVVELPGLYRDALEASLVYTRLVAQGLLRGYDDFFVIGVYATAPDTIHSQPPLASLADIAGKRIRVNNAMEGATLERLGATAILMPINNVTGAIDRGDLDAVSLAVAPLADYGLKRFTPNHYMLGTSGAPLALLMSRKRFESLPPPVQALIRKYSGEWPARRFAEIYLAADKHELEHMATDPAHHVVFPSPAERAVAERAFESVINQWLGEDRRRHLLLDRVQAELGRLRAAPRADR